VGSVRLRIVEGYVFYPSTVLDLIQVAPPVHTVRADRAPVGVANALEDTQSKGVGVGVGIGVRVHLCSWWRRLGIYR
jgi:hypothetical protein